MAGLAIRYLDYVLQGEVQRRLAARFAMLESEEGGLLLDCGCHAGEHSLQLAKRISPTRVFGLDYNERMLSGARKRGLFVVRCDVNKLLPFSDNSFNVVTAFDLIEHIVETETFVKELYRVIAPGGYLILDTPNLASWHNIVALVLGIQPFSGPNITTMLDSDLEVVRGMHRRAHQLNEAGEIAGTSEPELYRHIVVLAFRSALSLLRREGFVIEEARGFGYMPFPPFMARWLSRLDPAHAHHMLIKSRKSSGAINS